MHISTDNSTKAYLYVNACRVLFRLDCRFNFKHHLLHRIMCLLVGSVR